MRARPFGHDRSRVVKSGPSISDQELEMAHHFILCNCEEVELYLKIYKAEIRGVTLEEADEYEITGFELKQFSKWFNKHINNLWGKRDSGVTKGLWALANGPFRLDTKCYTGCMVNEVRFHTKDRDEHRNTQNSGLVVEGNYKNRVMEFFGYLSRVVELVYLGNRKVILFQCEWFDTGSKKTKQVDKHFISVDVGSRWYREDPFVLPINVKQVFYINDTKLGKNWRLVQRVQHRHLWDLPRVEPNDAISSHSLDPMQQFESDGVCEVIDNEYAARKLARDDLEPVAVDELLFQKIRNNNRSQSKEDDIDEMLGEEDSEDLTLGNNGIDCNYVNSDEDGESEHLTENESHDDLEF